MRQARGLTLDPIRLRRLAGRLALALLAPAWVGCSINQDVILILDPAADNKIILDIAGFSMPLESHIEGGFVGQATVPLDLLAVLTGRPIEGTISVGQVVIAGTQLPRIPTGTLCNLANPDTPTDGSVSIDIAREQGSATVNVRAVTFLTNPAFAPFVAPLPIEATIQQTFTVTLAQLLEIIGGGGGGLIPPSTQSLEAPIPPGFFGGGTATVTVTLVEGDGLPSTPLVEECVAYQDALPTHFLLGSSAAAEKLPDGTSVGAGELFAWDEKDGDVVFDPPFWGAQNIDAAHFFEDGRVWFSCADTCFVGGVFYRDGDVVAYDPATRRFTRQFAESALFAGDEDLDALWVDADATLLYSTETQATPRGTSLSVKDGDLVRYDAAANTHAVEFSEAAVFGGADADVDALHVLDDGRLLLSTDETETLPGELDWLRVTDGAVFAVDPAALPGSGGAVQVILSEGRIFQDEAELDAIGAFVHRGWDPGVNSPIIELP
jgi:hypothetical protein